MYPSTSWNKKSTCSYTGDANPRSKTFEEDSASDNGSDDNVVRNEIIL